MLGAFARDDDEDEQCTCASTFEGDRLVVAAGDCAGRGVLAEEPGCRATVVEELTDRDASVVLTRANGLERAYEDDAAALLTAAGRFADGVGFHDEHLAALAGCDPLRAARDAAGRAGPVARIAAESGLVEGADRAEGYEHALRPYVGPTVAQSRVAARPPPGGQLVDRRELTTGAVVRIYDRPAREMPTYHLEPVETALESELDSNLDSDSSLDSDSNSNPGVTATLARAHERLARGAVRGSDRAPGRAVRAVASPDDPVETLVAVLRKHTRGLGVLEDLFADEAVSDVFASAPIGDQPLRVRVDGVTMRTNVRLTERCGEALASQFRLTSGRSFSRASPTLDATATAGDRQIRVTGVTDPASTGLAFAFRAHDREPWTLPALIANGTLPADVAALLSLSVDRGAAVLVAGARGAGKTSLLGALLWELPASERVVVIEDTPELPVDGLRKAGRDVQPLRIGDGSEGPELGPAEALRTALRLGEGSLVVGEVRSEEARVLYEAMRVGAADGAVLGTIHGDGAPTVRERVVTDLGVPETAFADTDLVVTLATRERPAGPAEGAAERSAEVQLDGRPEGQPGGRVHRVTAVEEVLPVDDGVAFAGLYEPDGSDLAVSGRIERGNSRFVAELAGPNETYADVRESFTARADHLAELATGRTDPGAVVEAHTRRRADG